MDLQMILFALVTAVLSAFFTMLLAYFLFKLSLRRRLETDIEEYYALLKEKMKQQLEDYSLILKEKLKEGVHEAGKELMPELRQEVREGFEEALTNAMSGKLIDKTVEKIAKSTPGIKDAFELFTKKDKRKK